MEGVVEGMDRNRGADQGAVDIVVLHAQAAGGAVAEGIDLALLIANAKAGPK
jgi:hypothetical protein